MTFSRRFAFVPALVAGLVLAIAIGTPGARAYHTNFQGSCTNEYFNTTGVTRSQARIYAEIGASEGYQWGGGDLTNAPSCHSHEQPREPGGRFRTSLFRIKTPRRAKLGGRFF